LLLVFAIHVLLKIWFAGETCQRWSEDRRNGALELLLCAPLKIEDLVRGQNLALRRQFAGPIVATIGLSLLAPAGIIQVTGNIVDRRDTPPRALLAAGQNPSWQSVFYPTV